MKLTYTDTKHVKNREYLRKRMSDPEYRKKTRQYQREHYNPERAKRYKKNWLQNSPESLFISYKKWQNANRQKVRAKIMAERYVQLKPACEKCGKTKRLERHHCDYSKPLEVLTLCKNCHEAMPLPICSEPDKPDIRYLNGTREVLILDAPHLPEGSVRKWPVRALDTGEEFEAWVHRLMIFPKNTSEARQ